MSALIHATGYVLSERQTYLQFCEKRPFTLWNIRNKYVVQSASKSYKTETHLRGSLLACVHPSSSEDTTINLLGLTVSLRALALSISLSEPPSDFSPQILQRINCLLPRKYVWSHPCRVEDGEKAERSKVHTCEVNQRAVQTVKFFGFFSLTFLFIFLSPFTFVILKAEIIVITAVRLC